MTDTRPLGIDVSLYQDDITSVLRSVAFCIVKVSEGGFIDPKGARHLAAAKAAGVVTGAYHYAQPVPSGDAQAALFLANAKDAEILALDVESHSLRFPAVNRAFIAHVKAHDKRPLLLYSSEGTWPGDLGQDGNWVANYSNEPGHLLKGLKWAIWQYAGSTLDRDRFNGTLDQLHALAGRTPAPSTGEPMTNLVPLTTHRVVDLPAGTVLQKTPGGDIYTHLTKAVTLGLLGATSTHYHVADGDAGVYVARTSATVRTADLNVGA